MSAVATKLLTADEFIRLPERADGSREELVRGEVITMPGPGFRHGQVVMQVGFLLKLFLQTRPLGRVLAETGVRTEFDPDTVRGPDASYWSFATVPADETIIGYPEAPADLCIEVRSPSNSRRSLRDKAAEYLKAGVKMVWVVEPEDKSVTVYRLPGLGTTLWENELVQGEEVLPGFACPVSQFFEF